MKKYSIIVLAAVAVLAAVSCEKEKEKESTGFPAGLVDTLTPVDTIVPPDTVTPPPEVFSLSGTTWVCRDETVTPNHQDVCDLYWIFDSDTTMTLMHVVIEWDHEIYNFIDTDHMIYTTYSFDGKDGYILYNVPRFSINDTMFFRYEADIPALVYYDDEHEAYYYPGENPLGTVTKKLLVE